MRLDRQQRDRIDQRRQRRVVSVGPDFLRDILPVALQLSGRAAVGRSSFSSRVHWSRCASDLRLVHRLRGRQPAEFMEQIKKSEARHENDSERRRTQTAAPPDSSA